MRTWQVSALAALALSTTGCAAWVSKLRPDFVEPTTADAVVLTIVQAPKQNNWLSAVRDPVKCEGALNLGGSMLLEGERKVRLPPDKEFAFAVDLSLDTGFVKYSCAQMVVFTPEAGAEYRAVVHGTAQSRCGIELKKIVAGVAIDDLGAKRRRLSTQYGWKCVD